MLGSTWEVGYNRWCSGACECPADLGTPFCSRLTEPSVKHLGNIADAQALALAIVDTIPEPFVVLDEDLRVLSGSRRFVELFGEDQEQISGRLLYELGEGQWDIPALRLLLETLIPEHSAMDGFEVEHDFG